MPKVAKKTRKEKQESKKKNPNNAALKETDGGKRKVQDDIQDVSAKKIKTLGPLRVIQVEHCSMPNCQEPDGATIIPWDKGKCLIWDFTCSDTFAASYINLTKHYAGAAAELSVQRKHLKYKYIKSRGLILNMLGVETMGVWCDEGKLRINNKSIGRKLRLKTGEVKSKSYLTQMIGLSIQKGNAICILSSLPLTEKMEDILTVN